MNAGDDDKTWQDLWAGLGPRLLVYLATFGSLSREDRQDIVQRVFLKAWQSRSTLDGDRGLTAWFYRVARNEALDFLKKAQRESAHFPQLRVIADEGEAEIPGRSPTPEETALESELSRFMERFLGSLKDKERELSHLCYAEGLSYPEIARITGAPLGTVKWRALRTGLSGKRVPNNQKHPCFCIQIVLQFVYRGGIWRIYLSDYPTLFLMTYMK